MIQLRDYQKTAIDTIEHELAHSRSIGQRHATVCGACVGAGKSILIAEMSRRETQEREGRVLILTHVQELVEQDAEKVALIIGIKPGVYCAGLGEKSVGDLIVVASVQSLARNPMACGSFSLILVDEAHWVSPVQDGQYWSVLKGQPTADVIGFTGTPWRLESGPIYGRDRLFTAMTVDIRIAELQAKGHLCQITTKARKVMALDKVRVRMGEYDTGQQDAAIDPAVVVEALAAHTEGRKSVLIFVPGIRSGEGLTRALIAAGHSAAEVYGHTNTDRRDAIIDGFRNGEIRFLVNAAVLTTGFDAPRTDCVVLLRLTMSSALLIQMVGRGLRTHPEKTNGCQVLDYAGNFAMHPAIDEIEPPEHGDEKKKKKTQKKCEKCETLCKHTDDSCPCCGHVFERKDRALAFGQPVEMQTSEGYADKYHYFGRMALRAKQTGKQPVSAAIAFKQKFNVWPNQVIGTLSGHPFRWGFKDGKRVMEWAM